MKELRVSEKCNGCGICILNCNYLTENDDGNAVAIEGKAIAPSDLQTVEQVVNECPEGALSIVDISNTNKTGKAGLKDLLNKLKAEKNSFDVETVRSRDLKFEPEKCYIPVPHSRLERWTKYSSESKARAAAKSEFYNLCYSPSAYRPMLKKMFSEYKVNVLRPYYTCENSDNSIFYKYNKQLETILKRVYAEACSINGGSINLPSDWCDFSVFPKKSGLYLKQLLDFEERSECSGIMKEFETSGEKIDWYLDCIYVDSDSTYEGESWLGFSKYSYEYYFTDFDDAASYFIDHLKTSADYAADNIEEGAADTVNGILQEYKMLAMNEFERKIKDFERAIG